MAAAKKDPPAPMVFPTVQITFKDVFDFKELHFMMYHWLKTEGWIDKTTGDDIEYMEEFYLEKTGPTGAKDHIFYWEVEKFPPNTDYFKYSLSLAVTTSFLNPTEIMVNGKKINTYVGMIILKIVARLHPDYKAKWVNSSILGPFHELIASTMFKKEFEMHKELLYKQLYGFQAEIKRYLKLKQFISDKDAREGLMSEKLV